jgi:hypothetical protein
VGELKLLDILMLAALGGLVVYALRRRVFFALKTGAIVYVILLFGRLLLSAGSFAERGGDLVWPTALLLVIWVVLWWVSTNYAQRREREKQRLRSGSRAGRPTR